MGMPMSMKGSEYTATTLTGTPSTFPPVAFHNTALTNGL